METIILKLHNKNILQLDEEYEILIQLDKEYEMTAWK